MNTKFWGPPAWEYLHTVTFNYPETIDIGNPDHTIQSQNIVREFHSIQKTLPCKYCRQSFKQFLGELPIEPFLGSRNAITYWFYVMHNKVNHKLRGQEWDLFSSKVSELLNKSETSKQQQLQLQSKPAIDTKRAIGDCGANNTFFVELEKLANEILYTEPNPSYKDVCQFYNSQRAGCNGDPNKNKIESCRL